MYSSLSLSFVLFLSVFGLTSCNRNSGDAQGGAPQAPAPEVVLVQDTWSLSAPYIQAASEPLAKGITEVFDKPVSADATLHFPDKDDLVGVKIHVETTCLAKDGAKSGYSVELLSPNQIPLKSLLPHETYSTWQPLTDIQIQCDFTFVATNSVGSQHTFNIRSLKIARLNFIENLNLGWAEVAFRSAEPGSAGVRKFNALDIDKAVLKLSEPNIGEIKYKLLCSQFENHRSSDSNTPLHKVLNELAHGERQNANGGAIAGPEPRLSYRQQHCRLIAESKDTVSKTPLLWMTPDFVLNYPLLRADTSWHWHLQNVNSHTYREQKIIEVVIHNPNSVPIGFRLQNFSAGQMGLQYTYMSSFVRLPSAGPKYLESYQPEISGASRSWPQGEDIIIELAPHATATASLRFTTGRDCEMRFEKNSQLPLYRFYGFMGFLYHWPKPPPTVLQFSNWDPLSGQPYLGESTSMSTAPIPPHTEDGNFYHNWMPHSEWTGEMGAERPQFAAVIVRKFNAFHNGCPVIKLLLMDDTGA